MLSADERQSVGAIAHKLGVNIKHLGSVDESIGRDLLVAAMNRCIDERRLAAMRGDKIAAAAWSGAYLRVKFALKENRN